jgi:CHAT domain-containing protein
MSTNFSSYLKVTVISLVFSLTFDNCIATDALQQGEDFFRRGAIAQAIQHWETALDETQLETQPRIQLLIRLATAYQAKGHYATAHTILQQAQEEADRSGILEQQILVHSHLGDILLAMQKPDAARESLEEMLILARRHDDPLILAHLLNNLGNALYVLQEYVEALNAYIEVTELALRGGDPLLQIQALSNQVRVHLKRNDPAASFAVLEKALSQVQASLENHDKGFHLLSLGQLALRLQTNFQKDLPQVGSIAYRIFNEVLKLASQQQDKRLMSYAKGFLGQLYEREQRYQEATQLTRQAIFFAQDESDISYLWEWQQARLLQSQQDFTGAIRAYKLALEHLHPIRSRLFIGQRDTLEVFNERIRPVYFGLADLLLRQAAEIKEPETKTALLKQAREEIERLKLIELQEYFQSECLSAVQTQATELESRLDKHTAIFYPILFPDRTELLLSLPDGIHQVIIPVGADTLGEVVHQLRKNLQLSTSPRFIKQSTQLYQWLITPILPKLTAHDINTLIIVPDGSLRTVPLAALYDPKDKKFLMHRFALVTTPGLNLTDSRLLFRKNFKALLNGLSEGVQDFSPLPSVPDEIKNIGVLFEKNDILLDQKFSLENLNQSLLDSPYEVVHIASHGQFDSNPKKTFLLTYDSKLTMDRLQGLLGLNQLRKEPVELLTLSACQTAVGDERAALGLAGVAIKAGARSVIASLWFVNDESTAQLITTFYRNLIEDQSLSKAKALQKAQQKVAATQQFRHPAFWAPFLLIGNWL